jgi:hypothetical protein
MSRKLHLTLLVVSLALLLGACGGAADHPPAATPAPNSQSESGTSLPTLMTEAPAEQPIESGQLAFDSNDWFATAGTCVTCHQNNMDEAGNDVSNGEYWRSTMLANAAIDPYYQAGVSIEVERRPEFGAAIEEKCSICHMPMAHFSDVAQGQQGVIFGEDGYLSAQHPLHTLAVDGVSCTTCHQILSEGLGDFSSFSGGMVFDLQTPPGQRVLFGPFVPRESGSNIMSTGSGFVPQQGDHLTQSEMCATCHNLYTKYFNEEGVLSEDSFPEQMPYSEWLNSDYATQSTCQDCHMPLAEGAVTLSNLGPAIIRNSYAKHNFVGGNVYLLELIEKFGGDLGVQANTEHFDATIARTLKQLQSQTATLAISEPALTGTMLSFDISLSTLTGHKFPTGYPSRRVWLHVTVKDANGQVTFESGGVSNNGAISGNDNDAAPLAFEPHYTEITSPEQVQIYEAIMLDVYGNVTTELLSASAYVKDNRLLPTGFDKSAASNDIAPQGNVLTDNDFVGGADTTTYLIDTGTAEGPFTVEVELLYQSISYRWAQNLNAYDTEQAQTFSTYYNTLPNLPVVVDSQNIQSN